MENPGDDGMTVPTVGGGKNADRLRELPSHEVLARLARDDPQAYETLRSEVIEGFIDSAPQRLRPRLSGIQFRVDGLRRLSRASALGATVKIYALMWESFERLNHAWQDLRTGSVADCSTPAMRYAPIRRARILPLSLRPDCDPSRNSTRANEFR
jgi:hypothetical protein